MKIATFGAGCFWGVQESFNRIKGVKKTTVGYMGGKIKNPTYEKVCTNKTGYIEVVQIEYDPKMVSYKELLDRFWSVHDPTQIDRQGVDAGKQYRSIIFYTDDDQRKEAEKSKEQLVNSGKYKNPIVTDIKKADVFYKAEEYHQNYIEKNKFSSCKI